MAIPAEPATSAIFRALRSVDVDPDLAYEAAEESRRQAGENVIAAVGAKIDSQSARIDVQLTKFKAEMDTRLTHIEAEIKTQTSRIDVLQRVIWRVIWPLIVLLAAPIFGLLYKASTQCLPYKGRFSVFFSERALARQPGPILCVSLKW